MLHISLSNFHIFQLQSQQFRWWKCIIRDARFRKHSYA